MIKSNIVSFLCLLISRHSSIILQKLKLRDYGVNYRFSYRHLCHLGSTAPSSIFVPNGGLPTRPLRSLRLVPWAVAPPRFVPPVPPALLPM